MSGYRICEHTTKYVLECGRTDHELPPEADAANETARELYDAAAECDVVSLLNSARALNRKLLAAETNAAQLSGLLHREKLQTLQRSATDAAADLHSLALHTAQPMPVSAGDAVFPHAEKLARELDEAESHLALMQPHSYSEVIMLIESQQRKGLRKYGIPLMTKDGRNNDRDCAEELADAFMYAVKGMLLKQAMPMTRKVLFYLTRAVALATRAAGEN